jgi:hypothetical protein
MRTLLFVAERYRIMDFIQRHAPVAPALCEATCAKMAMLWETYSREDAEARAWHGRVYLAARRVDARLHRRLFQMTVQPWLGDLKNRLLSTRPPC